MDTRHLAKCYDIRYDLFSHMNTAGDLNRSYDQIIGSFEVLCSINRKNTIGILGSVVTV